MKKLLLNVFATLALSFGVSAQTTVTVTATGTAGSFNTGSVNSAGVKNDGNMININSTTNAGWAKFDLTTLPSNAVVMSVNCVFTTYTTTSSSATNNLYGFIGDPAVMAGAALYSSCNSGTSINAGTWTANATNTKTLNATGVTFVQNNITSNKLCIGFSRGSTNNYNIYGYPGTAAQQPMLVVTYSVPPACSGMPTAGTVVASNTLFCTPQNVNLSLTGSTSASGLSYQWLSSPDGISWNPIPTATTIATTQSVTATTYYQCAVACGTNVATSSTITITVGANPNAGVTAATSTMVCPNQPINLSLIGASTTPGLTYQWQSSSNGVTYSPIAPTASLATTTQTITSGIYFQNVLTCGSATAVSTPIQVMTAGTTTNTVPYFEGFEGITFNNQLPNCSWMATSPGTICLTYTATPPPTVYNRVPKSGTKFGSFRWGTATTGDYFYTNGILLTAGTNYIASADYIADGAAGWSEFSLLVGSTQSTVGLATIASITGAITNTVYANASGTFSVPTTGIYYIAVKAIGNSTPWYLTFDDLKVITAPTCTLAPLAGVISGPNNVTTGSVNAYTISPATGNIQWYTGATTTGPWSPVASATAATNQTITAAGSGTVYYTAIASTPGCVNDTANTPLAVNVIFPGDNVCNAIPLTIGASTVQYSVFGATTQTGEVVPPGTGCSTNNSWCNATLNNSLWFTFVAPTSGYVSVQSPDFDTQLAIWKANTCSDLLSSATATLVAANDDDANYTTNAGVQFSSYLKAACLIPGATYYIQLDSYGAATSTDKTKVLVMDMGAALDASFTGLSSNYCLPASSSSLTAATAGGIFTINTSTASVTSFSPSTAGTFTVTYSVLGCVSNSMTTVANVPTVAASASSPSVCAGSSATLTASGATNYTWTAGGNASTEIVTLSSASVYTVTGEASGCSNTATVSVGVTASPTVMAMTSNTSICAGSSATLTASGATNYTWTSGGNTSTEVVTPTGNSTYTVTGEDLGCTNTAIVSVNVNAIPVVSAVASQTLLCDNGSSGASILTASTSATTYAWSDGATTMTTSVTPTLTTTYTVTVTELGCSADAFVTITVSNCNGVKELVANGISIYPNPTNSILNITISSELSGNTSIEVYDAVGKLVIKESLSTETTTINTSKLTDGIYVFKVINNNQAIKIGKIVKQ